MVMKLLYASTAVVLMSGSLALGEDPITQFGDRHIQAIGAHDGLPVADVGYVPPEIVAAERQATERRMRQQTAARSVSDVGYVPPERGAPQRQEGRAAADGPVADVGYVPPDVLAGWRLNALREEQRLAYRIAALRQARRSFYRPVSDVGYVPPEVVAAQRITTSLRQGHLRQKLGASIPAPAAMRPAAGIEFLSVNE